MRDVVVTGIGLVTPIGIGVPEVLASLRNARSGAGPITSFETDGSPVRIAAEVSDFEASDFMEARTAARTDRFSQMAEAAALLAWEEASFAAGPDADRTGVIIGSGIGGLATIEQEHAAFMKGGPRRVSPFMVPKLMPNGAAAAVAMRLSLWGPNFAPASACATGAHAVGEAARCIEAGLADVMLAGGSESAITPLSVSAFARMGALSKRNDDPERASRPFDLHRDGFVFGEGAGVLVLESRAHAEERGARVYAGVTGYGATSDAYHATQPDPEGRGATRAIHKAMADAGVEASDIDYVNAHGTSTPFNDRIETIALRSALGDEATTIPISSTKSQTGHLLGAAGAVEAAICALSIDQGFVPPTINLDDPDPECDLDYVTEGPREKEVRVALSNSFGFGGQNACLILQEAS